LRGKTTWVYNRAPLVGFVTQYVFAAPADCGDAITLGARVVVGAGVAARVSVGGGTVGGTTLGFAGNAGRGGSVPCNGGLG
jgi:hypothetical protein